MFHPTVPTAIPSGRESQTLPVHRADTAAQPHFTERKKTPRGTRGLEQDMPAPVPPVRGNYSAGTPGTRSSGHGPRDGTGRVPLPAHPARCDTHRHGAQRSCGPPGPGDRDAFAFPSPAQEAAASQPDASLRRLFPRARPARRRPGPSLAPHTSARLTSIPALPCRHLPSPAPPPGTSTPSTSARAVPPSEPLFAPRTYAPGGRLLPAPPAAAVARPQRCPRAPPQTPHLHRRHDGSASSPSPLRRRRGGPAPRAPRSRVRARPLSGCACAGLGRGAGGAGGPEERGRRGRAVFVCEPLPPRPARLPRPARTLLALRAGRERRGVHHHHPGWGWSPGGFSLWRFLELYPQSV